MTWNFLLLFSALYLDLPEDLPLLCSGGSSKAGHIKQATNEVAPDDIFDAHTSALREEMVKFCKAALEGSHQREDYEEFLKLSLIFQCGAKRPRVSFQTPETFHHAH